MLTECAICYSLQECADDGEALICEDRAACQRRMLENIAPRDRIDLLDDPAIGRKITRLMNEDRDTLVAILDGAHRAYWPKLAHGYLQALGIDSQESRAQIVPGVVYVWSQLVKEAYHYGAL